MRKSIVKDRVFKIIIIFCLLIFFIYGYFTLVNRTDFNDFLVFSINNRFIMTSGYKVLFAYGKNREVKRNIEDILRLYQDFNNKIII